GSFADEPVIPPSDSISSVTRFFRHLYALMIKRFHDARRNFRLLLFSLIYPTLLLLLTLSLLASALNYGPSRPFTTDVYNDDSSTQALYSRTSTSVLTPVVVGERVWNTEMSDNGI